MSNWFGTTAGARPTWGVQRNLLEDSRMEPFDVGINV